MEIILLIIIIILVAFAIITVGLAINFFWWIVIGIVVGGLARFFVSNTSGLGLIRTVLAGITGSLVGGLIGEEYLTGGVLQFVISIFVAALMVMLLRMGKTK